LIEDHTILLTKGRQLGYGEFGHDSGEALLYVHGSPSSRLNPSALIIEEILMENNALPFRVYAVERPGYGLSDPMNNWTFKDWIEDLRMFLERLNIQRFSILGISGGGPYALACANAFGSRVQKTAIICGMGPVYIETLADQLSTAEQDMILAAQHAPEKLQELAEQIHQDPFEYIRTILSGLPEEERKNMPKEMITGYEAAFYEATFHGDGMIADYRNFSSPWGFEFGAIKTPVRFWHSMDDKNVPLSHSQYLSERIPLAELTVLSGLDHYMSSITPLSEVLSYLAK
jgi:pimeloyl-ACP methyl ester carboxylesterase